MPHIQRMNRRKTVLKEEIVNKETLGLNQMDHWQKVETYVTLVKKADALHIKMITHLTYN